MSKFLSLKAVLALTGLALLWALVASFTVVTVVLQDNTLERQSYKLDKLQQQVQSLRAEVGKQQPLEVEWLKYQLASVSSFDQDSSFWKEWDADMATFIGWYADGQPATFGNLGDQVLPVLIKGARAHKVGAHERYLLVKQYLALSAQLRGQTDAISVRELSKVEQTF